jgi:alkyldihydroxyacetonephosphate synthase
MAEGQGGGPPFTPARHPRLTRPASEEVSLTSAGRAGRPRSTIRLVSSLDILASRLPGGTVSTDPQTLYDHAIDSWSLALLRRVRGDDLPEPVAVISPARTEEVATVLAWASQTGTAVIPRGAGSGVCGGAQADTQADTEADTQAVVLDLSRMDRIGEIDVISHTVEVQAGVRGDRLEDELAKSGLTTGHYPQSIAISTVGGWIAASSAGQASTGFGAIEDVLLGLTAVLPDGEILRLRPVPRSAAGPDLKKLIIGSEGTLAVVTEATLACRARPRAWEWLAFAFPGFTTMAEALRDVKRAETGAAVLRGYDETDAQLGFGALNHTTGCVGLAGFPSGPPGLDARKQAAQAILQTQGTELGARYGEHWWQHRNGSVQTYAQIMGPERSFGPGVIVDTMEVAGLWSNVPRLYGEIQTALSAHAQAVACHLSHLYPSGSSLYFTFLITGADDHEAESTYRAAWQQAAHTCAEAGGTITHHHGVGRLKAPFLETELGESGAHVLTRIRKALDPARIMNPGVLQP